MVGSMEGMDAVVFTAGAGEGSARLRSDVGSALAHLGVRIDSVANDGAGDRMIGVSGSTPALVVHAREDLTVAREVVRVLGGTG